MRRRVHVWTWRGKLAAVSLAAWFAALGPVSYAQTVVNGGGGVGGGGGGSVSFPLLAPDGTAGAPSYSWSSDPDTGFFLVGADNAGWSIAGARKWVMTSSQIGFDATYQLGWYSVGFGAFDTFLTRAAAGVVTTTSWIQNTAGDQVLTANHTNATVTPTNITDLTTTVTSGRKYVFEFIAQVDNSTDADGIRFDFDGGNATATDFRVTCKSFNNNLTTATSQTTALATDITEASYVGAGSFECNGSFEPSSTGTFIPRAGMNTAASGTLTVFRGSHLLTHDMP